MNSSSMKGSPAQRGFTYSSLKAKRESMKWACLEREVHRWGAVMEKAYSALATRQISPLGGKSWCWSVLSSVYDITEAGPQPGESIWSQCWLALEVDGPGMLELPCHHPNGSSTLLWGLETGWDIRSTPEGLPSLMREDLPWFPGRTQLVNNVFIFLPLSLSILIPQTAQGLCQHWVQNDLHWWY